MTGSRISQTRIIWAAICGLVAFVLAKLAMGYGFWFSLLIGLVVVAIVLLLAVVFAPAEAEGGASPSAAPVPAADPAPAPPPAAAFADLPPAPPAEEAVEAPAETPDEAGDKAPDDLKQIEGIGPALEKLLHELGVTRFAQIAGWSEAEIAAVDAQMGRFRGRIARDRWVAQARIIVTEGLEAFRERAKTNDY